MTALIPISRLAEWLARGFVLSEALPERKSSGVFVWVFKPAAQAPAS